MRKKIMVLGISTLCLLLTACGEKKMTCTVTTNIDESSTYETIIKIKYKENTIKSMDAILTFANEQQAAQIYEIGIKNDVEDLEIVQKENKIKIKNYDNLINKGSEKKITKKEIIEKLEYMEYECK